MIITNILIALIIIGALMAFIIVGYLVYLDSFGYGYIKSRKVSKWINKK